MPDFQPINPAGGGGGFKPRSPKMNKKTIAIYGGIGIAAFVLMSSLMKRPDQSQEAGGTVMEDYPNPMNGADVQAQLQNFMSIVEGQQEAAFNQFANEMYAEQLAMDNDYKMLMEDQRKSYTDQLQALKGEYDSFKGESAAEDLRMQQEYNQLKQGYESNLSQLQNQLQDLQNKPAPIQQAPTVPAKSIDMYRLQDGAGKLVDTGNTKTLFNLLGQGYKVTSNARNAPGLSTGMTRYVNSKGQFVDTGDNRTAARLASEGYRKLG